MEDARSKKIVFVASCLLNTNNKVMGLGRYPGLCKEVFDTLYEYGFGINQLHCPETLYLGLQRWWSTKDIYDSAGFRRYCRELAVQIVDYIENYHKSGYKVVAILGCDGSPTCGVDITTQDKRWGGSPVDLDFVDTLTKGSGVYMEEIKAEIASRSLEVPPFYGLALDDESADMAEILRDFNAFIRAANG
jgi:predicted secreted protein